MYLFFDTETTGLPKSWKAPITDSENWPRLVQLAWMEFDANEQLIASHDRIIKPHGFEIPAATAKIHGITNEIALSRGVGLSDALNEFSEALQRAQFLVAHNLSFDESIVAAELHRLDMPNNMLFSKKLCTKELSTRFCKLPSRYGYKWPTLQELHIKLFGDAFEEAHNASVDVGVCAKCFFELKKLGEFALDGVCGASS